MKQTTMIKLIALLSIIFLPQLALAHTGGGHENGFIAGLGHPVLGMDHFLAMVAVGIVSALMGGKAIWTVPAAFVVAMLIGGVAGGMIPDMPFIELGIVSSVIALGAVIALGKQRLSQNIWMVAMGFVGFFGLFHGYAHGSEMPEMVEPLLYGAGFVTGTIGLHLLGVFIGIVGEKLPKGDDILRVAGGVMSAVGLYILTGLFV